MSEEILKRIDAFAAKLGVTAAHLWSVLIQQAAVEARQDLMVCGVWICIGIAAGILIRVGFKSDHDLFDEAGPVIALALIALGGIVIASIYGFASWTEFVNPEYWALKQISGLVK